MQFTQEDAAAAARAIGIDLTAEKFTLAELTDGMNAELRHGTKAPTSPTMTPQ